MKTTYIKNKDYKGLSAYSDKIGQVEINYIWFKKLLLQPWSILKKHIRRYLKLTFQLPEMAAKCVETKLILNG